MGRVTPLYTPRYVLNITYQTPQETLLGTPITLPTSEPPTPQIGYTVASGDLPAFSVTAFYKIWVAMILGAGKFVTSGTVYWRMKKNGGSVATGSTSIGANTFYTISAYFFDVAVNDLLELALWSNQTDSNYDYKAYQIQPTRIMLMGKIRDLKPFSFSAIGQHPALTLGNPYFTLRDMPPYHDDKILPYITAPTNYSALYAGTTYGTYRLSAGDVSYYNTATIRSSPIYRPYYYRNYVPTQIILRGLRLD